MLRPDSTQKKLKATRVASRERFTGLLWAYALILCAAVWIYAGLEGAADYRRVFAAEQARLRSVSLSLAAQMDAMLGDGIGAAVAATNELRSTGGIEGATEGHISDTLAHMLTGGEYVWGLFLVTPRRFVLVSRNNASAGHSPVPEVLVPVPQRSESNTWVGAPVPVAAGSPDRLIPITRRVSSDGSDSTWAGALFALGALANIYQQPVSGSGVGIFRTDGTALALVTAPENRRRLPLLDGSGVGASPIFRYILARLPDGVAEGINPYTGKEVSIAFRTVRGYPLLAVASRERDAILSDWYLQAREELAMAVALTLLVCVATFLLSYFARALRIREQHYRTLFDNAAFGALVLESQRFVEANRTTAAMFGVCDPSELIGLQPEDLSPPLQPNGQPSVQQALEHVASAVANGSRSFEWLHKRLDTGQPFYATVDLSSINADGQTLTLAVLHDVTQSKRAEEEREHMVSELRELTGALIRSQDEERRRIGRDLHDATGQLLIALEMRLSRAVRTGAVASVVPILQECLDLAHRCSNEIRTASYLLHPPLLDEIGLLSALRWLADGLRGRSELQIILDLPHTMGRLPPDYELAMFRVAQEALTNVHRHSISSSATIRLKNDRDCVTLEIEDNGCGLGGSSAASPGQLMSSGVGLAGMRERMRQLGGTLSVSTGPKGTCVRACVLVQRVEDAPPSGSTVAL